MFEWLSQLPIIVQIFIIVILTISFLYLAINLIKRGFSFTKYNTMLTVGNNNQEILPPHARCSHAKDIIIVLNEIQQILHQKYIVEYKEQMQTQMNYAEQKTEQIRMLCQKVIIEELEKHNLDTELFALNIFIVKLFLKDIQNIIIDLLRTSFHINRFAEMSERDFTIFCEEKADFIIFQLQEAISEIRTYNNTIPGIKLAEIIMNNLKNKFIEIIIDIYQNARSIAIDNKVKLLSYDEKISAVLKKYIFGK